MKKIISFLAIICFLAGSPAGNTVLANAASRGLTGGGLIPAQPEETQPAELPSSRVTFENEEKQSPDLYVSKRVEHADESYPAPEEDEFRFILKIDGRLADQVPYQVYDAENKEVDGDFHTGKYKCGERDFGQTEKGDICVMRMTCCRKATLVRQVTGYIASGDEADSANREFNDNTGFRMQRW